MQSVGRASASTVLSAVSERLRASVRIDARTLALFRIVVALLILADLRLRARNFGTFYTDDGLVPISMAREAAPIDVVSIYTLSGDPTVTAGLFVLHGLIALQLLVGYRTRLATALSFAFVVSLDLRNPLVLSYADVLFAWLLLWAIFVPLGERWSIDAVHADRPPRESVASLGTALILLQMVTMYVVNGVHKSTSDLWRSGEAAPLVLGLDELTFLLGDTARSVPTLLQYGGVAWFVMLLFAWLLVLVRGRVRTALVCAFASVHLSFAVTVRIGAFAYVALAGVLLFLQTDFWDDLATLRRRLERRSIQPGAPVDRLPAVGCGFGSVRRRLIALAEGVPRATLGLETPGWLPRDPSRTVLTAGVLVFAALAAVSLLSAGGLVASDAGGVQEAEAATAAFVSHQTEWSIFAPNPRTTDRYYVFPAKTADGTLLDRYNDRELSYERPTDELQTQYGTYRERFYMTSVANGDPPAAPKRLAESLCAAGSADGDELTHVNMYRVEEEVTLETIDSPSERDRSAVVLFRHGCGDHEPTEFDPPEF
ncbi:HTTM domain-containing protein [Natrarchaeobius halalkaliphilus]|uniref:HTTM domain-containing protein n=1 Tax=Natrarchaeobius halalkaliphilus TaxID=1679091 RepID=A0A3N6MBY3_9EURY|nr:HTTM domain-containing protein [Natrarchaeobius halalkaliphilus]RQG92991.1 HTTM domain-containing protein [Natrarchaeobius halalkaliphilus]